MCTDEEDDEVPTRRDSGSLEIFQKTATEAAAKLRELELDDAGACMLVEAMRLEKVFVSWTQTPPTPEARTAAIQGVMGLHSSVEGYVAKRRATTTGGA